MPDTRTEPKKIAHVYLTDEIRRLAGMRAEQRARSLSAYIADLVLTDAKESGLADFIHGSEVVDG